MLRISGLVPASKLHCQRCVTLHISTRGRAPGAPSSSTTLTYSTCRALPLVRIPHPTQTARRRLVQLTALPALTNEDLAQPFLLYNSILTYSFLPLLIAPRWKFTKAFYESEYPLVVVALTFLYFFVAATIIDNTSSEDAQQKIIYLFTEAITDPRKMAATFNTPAYVAQDWVHLTAWDFFAWRWIYLDALKYNLPIRFSVLTVFNAGPLGLLVHLTTKAVVQTWRQSRGEDVYGAMPDLAAQKEISSNAVKEELMK